MGCKLLNGIKSMYVNILACVGVKEDESECFRINSGVRQGCIISPWLFNVYVDTVMMEGKKGVRLQEEGTEWRLPSLLNANDLGLCGGSEEDLRVMVGHFAEVCRRGLKVNAGKNKVISVRWGRGVIV